MSELFTLNNKGVKHDVEETMCRKISHLERFRCVFGKVVVIVLISFLLERTYGTMCHYFEHPTYFETRYVSQFYAQMPALTMCPLKGYKPSVLKVKLIILTETL